MIKEIFIKKEVDLAFAECKVLPAHWSTSRVNSEEDDDNNPKMPCVYPIRDYRGEERLVWKPIIDLDEGKIVNWKPGVKATIYYKAKADTEVTLMDRAGNVLREYIGCVPRLLDTEGEGDIFVFMEVDKDGNIEDFNNYIEDILMHEME